MQTVLPTLISTKRCVRCDESRPLSEFGSDRGKPDGLAFYCRKCARAVNAAWRESNRERFNARHRAWRAANRNLPEAEIVCRRTDRSRRTFITNSYIGEKKCSCCQEIRQISNFKVRLKASCTWDSQCNDCLNRKERARNAEQQSDDKRVWSYVSERICPKCLLVQPISQFRTNNVFRPSKCKTCYRAARSKEKRAYVKRRPEWAREQKKRYRQRHHEKWLAYQAEYRKRPEVDAKRREYNSRHEYRLKKAEADRARMRDPEYRKKRKDQAAAWKAANPELVRRLHKAAKHVRKARLKHTGPSERFLDIEIYERDGWICQLCHKPVVRDAVCPDPLSPSIDHIHPVAKGGCHTRANTQLAHFMCNSLKRDLIIDSYVGSAIRDSISG